MLGEDEIWKNYTMNLKFIIPIFFVLLINVPMLIAQSLDNEKFEASIVLGEPFINLKRLGNYGYWSRGLSTSYTKKNHHLLLRFLRTTITPSGKIPYRKEHTLISSNEIAFLYGFAKWYALKKDKSYGYIAISVGINYSSLNEKGEEIGYETYETKDTSFWGIPINIQLSHFIPSLSCINPSIKIYSNLTKSKTYSGILIGIGYNR